MLVHLNDECGYFDMRSGVDALLIGSWIVLLWCGWVQVMIGSFGVGIAMHILVLLLLWDEEKKRELERNLCREREREANGSKVALRVMIIPCIKMLLYSTLEWLPLFVPWFKKPIDYCNCFSLFPSDSLLLFMLMVQYGVLPSLLHQTWHLYGGETLMSRHFPTHTSQLKIPSIYI